MLNTLGVRSALGAANRRKLSFRNVSNVVVQLLHTIKYSVPVPFSHMATGQYPGNNGGAPGVFCEKNTRKVGAQLLFLCAHSNVQNNNNIIAHQKTLL